MHKHKLKKTPENRGKFYYWPYSPVGKTDYIRSFTCEECGALFFVTKEVLYSKLSGDTTPFKVGSMWWKRGGEWVLGYTLIN